MAAAPVGWTRTGGITQTFGLRIVASATVGGTSGGTDDPILNDKVPSHLHTFTAATGNNSADHSHAFSGTSGYMNQNASHNHGISDPGHSHPMASLKQTSDYAGGGNNYYTPDYGASSYTGAAGTGISIAGTDTNHTHNLSGNTGGASQVHTHSVSGSTVANASAANWAPRYIDMILCTKD